MSRHPDSELTDSSLESYLARRPGRPEPLVAHSDGGSTYRSGSWKRICSEGGVVRSMSRKGCCPDNARAEGFFGTLKEEFYNGRDWSQVGFDEFRRMLDGYLEWYVHGRLKAFREGGRTVYDTIAGRRRRLGAPGLGGPGCVPHSQIQINGLKIDAAVNDRERWAWAYRCHLCIYFRGKLPDALCSWEG